MSPASYPDTGIKRISLATPPNYMPGDNEYEGDIRYWETSTPRSTPVSILDYQPYRTKQHQWENHSKDDTSMDLGIQKTIHDIIFEDKQRDKSTNFMRQNI